MNGPYFWYAAEGREAAPLTRALLTPLSLLYSAAGTRRLRHPGAAAGAPVICIGNVTLGGAGKTPAARAVLARLRARGVAAHALSRGHGGRLAGPVRVDPAAHTHRDVGDEPLLLAQDGPAWIARDRLAGARAAVAGGAQAVVMDDGFQNPSLHKDLSLLVIDAARPYGNGRVFPAGPLREPATRALGRADAVIVMVPSPDVAPDMDALGLRGFGGPALRAWLVPRADAPDLTAAGPLVAFAGIGRPQKFFDSLCAAGATLAEEVGFPDHHVYSRGNLAALTRLAAREGAGLVTTEKDHVRLPAEMRARIMAWPAQACFDDMAALDALLDRVMG